MEMSKGEDKTDYEAYNMFKLGLCYSLGIGMPHDEKEAMFWFQKATIYGSENAKVMLNLIAYEKSGVPLSFTPFSSSNYAPFGRYFQITSNRGVYFVDLVEFSDRYLAIEDAVNKEADDMCPKDIGLGRCHMFWDNKQRILKEKYGIIWHSPSLMNFNHLRFD